MTTRKKKKNPVSEPISDKPDGEQAGEEEHHLEKMARMGLRQTRLLGPPGARLYDPQWIFILLAHYEGLIWIENHDESDDRRWLPVFGAGLPRDMRRIDLVFPAGAFHKNYEDFVIHIRGAFVDEQKPDRGKGGWTYRVEHNPSGEEFRFHIWFIQIYLRDSQASLIAHYTGPNADPRYKELTGRSTGIVIELMDHHPYDKGSSHRLIDNDVLFVDLQSILDAATEKSKGPKPRRVLTMDQRKRYWPALCRAKAALKRAMEDKAKKNLSGYEAHKRTGILSSALPDAPVEVIEALAIYTTKHEIALQYAMWEVSEAPIGTWEKDSLIDYMNESKGLNREK